MGATLHFLKAEILKSEGATAQAILEEYKLAANLASQNPFKTGALFMEDDQPTPDIEKMITTYRMLAIEWGTNELKDFVSQLYQT